MTKLNSNGLTPKGQKAENRRKVAVVFSSVLVPLLTGFILSHSGLSIGDAVWWAIFIPAVFIGVNFLSTILTFAAVISVYGLNKDEIGKEIELMKRADNTNEDTSLEVPITITRVPEKPIAMFLDKEIFEWIEFTANGRSYIGHFDGTINVDKGHTFPIPNDSMLIQPGILYKIEPKENGQQEKVAV